MNPVMRVVDSTHSAIPGTTGLIILNRVLIKDNLIWVIGGSLHNHKG